MKSNRSISQSYQLTNQLIGQLTELLTLDVTRLTNVEN